jgi:hypothetical protein
MTIAEQLRVLHAAARGLAETNRGHAYVATDRGHVVSELLAKPGGFQCAVFWDTEDVRGEHSELGKVDRQFKVVISRGRGLRLETGESLTEGSAGGRPLYDLVEELRESIRSLRLETNGDDEDRLPGYAGSGPFEVQGYLLDAVEVRFRLPAQIPVQENL